MMLVCTGVMADSLTGDGSLSGKVTDKRSGEALVGVTIYFPSLSTGPSPTSTETTQYQIFPTKKSTYR